MSHLMSDLRHCVHIGQHLAVLGYFRKLLLIEGDIALRSHGGIVRRLFLHLVRADVHWLNKLPLEAALAAKALETALCRANAGNWRSGAAQRAVTGRASLLVVDAKIRIVSQKIKFISERFENGAGQIARIRQRIIMKGFVDNWQNAVLWLGIRKVHFRAAQASEGHRMA